MIRNFLYNFLFSLYTAFSHYMRIFKIFKGFNAPSCSIVEGKTKSKPSQLIDYLYLFFVLKILPSNYHLFCLDVKNRREFKLYIGDSLADPHTIRKLDVLWKHYWIFLKDKLNFKLICQHYKIPVPAHLGTYQNGMENDPETDLRQMMLEKGLPTIVLKPRDGHMGENIHIISNKDSNISKNVSSLQGGEYIIEEHIKQHPEMNKINPHSINTVRIITFLCLDGTVEILGAILRTSSSTLHVDNFAMGGIAIGIDVKTGRLKNDGFARMFYLQNANEINLKQHYAINTLNPNDEKKLLSVGKILTRHPLTQTKFFNFKIPYWTELKEITINAQKIFYHIKSVGWDVALSSTGPVIIEGNTSWGTTGLQAANGGLLTDKNKRLFAQYGISFYR